MSYIDDELKIGVDEEEDEDVEDDLDATLGDIPEEDDILDDEFIGLSDTSSEY